MTGEIRPSMRMCVLTLSPNIGSRTDPQDPVMPLRKPMMLISTRH